ncbi:glycosyltransferase family 4 protein [Pseudomonas monteilii]|uniref:Glycosyltransferase family 4 protein n=1 Tax=Pseudomonas monteilii TaxID=76759 RepID=A0A7X3F300_9PSED|nr:MULTISPECIES: glycosyltransferase family 4 protein [Pseudomonas]MBI6918984.1 glycosyltransferase family 4 protein [Pseudomonas monteilii]MCE0937110.1 glycosyltransferase family 4 protein [Pseudomonas kurunegalensis]MDT3745667.1 glycosyltransferase family 4 protein [Pseudomonas kurunegalensis]MVF50533.1 glycosyltransferase family 4 protein [Pseudomonas monteilii]
MTHIIKNSNDVCLAGHPFAPIGMGEHVRATFRSLRAVYTPPVIHDIYKIVPATEADSAEFGQALTEQPAAINIFHINGNEVEHALEHINQTRPWTGYNIIYPLWELPRYPDGWAEQLDRFDEIWAASQFVMDGLQAACKKPVVHMPLATEVHLDNFFGRRYFGLPEADYVFLFFYDLRSYSARKNPQGVFEAFRQMLAKRPYANTHLVIKVNGVDMNPQAFTDLQAEVKALHGRVTLIERTMSSTEVKNLLRCSDCFVSLHRSEGYGFGIAEAMALGKPVIATAYSGNMDFMAAHCSLPVDYRLVAVKEGEYPHYEAQHWADPYCEQAVAYMVQLVDDPSMGRALGQKARLHMQSFFSYRYTGLRYRARLAEIRQMLSES